VKNYLNQLFFNKTTTYQTTVIGLILAFVGIIFLYDPTSLHLKVSVSMILIGSLIIYLLHTNEKSTPRTITSVHLLVIITFWILLVFALIRDIDTDIFLIIVIIGILVIKELTDDFIDPQIKKRIDVLFYIFIVIFAVIVAQRVINILGI
jgi:hypothetical protein